ncbi:molybdate ABC transporter substrate-binding protein [Anaerovorax odorimutans]|uniref:molybdate ABC transporter substrate-binding protein n=1 Tax=Anaerovorax odorimutans TaxID=109327 RepID=UPI0004171482|nr:molybdate ABC transporter substrate-binding protein [Anaerovorax odorimutans]
MKKLSLILIMLLVFSFGLAGCGQQNTDDTNEGTKNESKAVEVNVSAAASLTDALNEIKAEYEKDSNNTIVLNFASSGTLRKQIEEGAPCDLFISASKEHMDTLENSNLIDAETRSDLLNNSLTLIAAKEKKDVVVDENSILNADVKSVSIGTPESVPAGKYAQEALENLGMWDDVQSKLVLAKDVRQVLEYVDTGNVDCGLVYKSDALLLTSGVVVCDMPEDSHSKIVYPAAITAGATQAEAAKDFYKFLQSDYSKGVFEKYGFTVI